MMINKKHFSLIFTFFISFVFLHAQKLPDSILGIWEGKDRYVFFEENQPSSINPNISNQSSLQTPPENQAQAESYIVIILKEYYGWYLDRAAEAPAHQKMEERTRNAATPKKAQYISIENIKTKESKNSLYGSLDLFHTKHDINTIPFFILGDSLYLKYYEQKISDNNYTFYAGIAASNGFTLNVRPYPKDISGLIIDGSKLYDVRYWQTDMEYSDLFITFAYKEDSYQIPCHISSCGVNYSCVSGRSKKVRNPVKAFEYEEENYLFNDDKTVFTPKEEPYLIRLADKKTFEDLMKLIKEANSRIKAPAAPPFPPSNLDWHWDLIDQLEKGNIIISEVRQRQKSFGPRGKDFSR